MGPLDTSVDGIHRAATWGLQAGVLGWALSWIGLVGIGCPCLAFALFFLVGAAAASAIATLEINPEGKAVLITGCDSGFGHHLALRLEKLGFVVFAGCLSKDGDGARALLKQTKSGRMVPVQLNVGNQQEVDAAVESVTKQLEEKNIHGLWGVVNNAGISTFGHVEWVPVEDSQRIMDINIWGMVRVTKAFLPLIRRAKGRVVNVASALGRFCYLDRSSYGMTKYAVESFSDVLRFEMRKFGVKVSIIEPGNFVNATSIYSPDSIKRNGDRLWAGMPEHIRNAYGEDYFQEDIRKMIYYSTKGPTDVEPVLVCMTQPLMQTMPAPRYQPMDWAWKVRCQVNTHLPEWIYELIYVRD